MQKSCAIIVLAAAIAVGVRATHAEAGAIGRAEPELDADARYAILRPMLKGTVRAEFLTDRILPADRGIVYLYGAQYALAPTAIRAAHHPEVLEPLERGCTLIVDVKDPGSLTASLYDLTAYLANKSVAVEVLRPAPDMAIVVTKPEGAPR